jgi:hypothetical protein
MNPANQNMFYQQKNRLTRMCGTGYKIERVYKNAPTFSWNPLISGGFFPSANPFHAAEGVFLFSW